MISFRASQRDLLAVFFSLTTTLLHSICCLLPLYASFAAALGRSTLWRSVQPYLLAAQVLVLLYCVARIPGSRQKPAKIRIYLISALVSLTGLGLGVRDSIHAKERAHVTRILDNLRYQESVTLFLPEKPVPDKLDRALANLKGVKAGKTTWEEFRLTVHYHSGITSEEEILKALTANGYLFEKQISYQKK